MRGILWTSLILVLLGTLGIFFNIYLGFGLTKDLPAQSDLHLTFALSSVFSLILGSIGLIRASKTLLYEYQKAMLENKNVEALHSNQDLRSRCLSLALIAIATAILSMITGTISQTGRFPLVHGLIGFALAGISLLAIYLWINLIRRI